MTLVGARATLLEHHTMSDFPDYQVEEELTICNFISSRQQTQLRKLKQELR